MAKATSEFGKGFVYNLNLFAQHFENSLAASVGRFKFLMNKTEEERKKIMEPNPEPKYNYGKDMDFAILMWQKFIPIHGTPEKTLSHQIEIWANGASDHLYELEVPEKWKKTKIGKLAKKIQERGLSMGHGFTGRTW